MPREGQPDLWMHRWSCYKIWKVSKNVFVLERLPGTGMISSTPREGANQDCTGGVNVEGVLVVQVLATTAADSLGDNEFGIVPAGYTITES